MSIFLDNVLKAIHNSVIEAQKITEQQHMRALGRYFYLNKEKMEDEGIEIEDLGMPKMIDIKLPFPEDNEISYKTVEVPLIALNPPSSMKIKNMKVSFEAKITGVDPKKEERGFFKYFKKKNSDETVKKPTDTSAKGPIQLDLTPGNKDSAGMAKIEIEFVNSDVPETYARINDHLIKSFPF